LIYYESELLLLFREVEMRALMVTDDVGEQLGLLGRAWDCSASDVLRRVLKEYRRQEDTPETNLFEEQIAVYAIYGGIRTEGLFDPVTGALKITTGILSGRVFSKPSGAAGAVVQAHSPDVNPNRNGWLFWIVSKTGKRLQSVRRKRRAGS
jgi:hypothetical protein